MEGLSTLRQIELFVIDAITIIDDDIKQFNLIRQDKLDLLSKELGLRTELPQELKITDHLFASHFIDYLIDSRSKTIISRDAYTQCRKAILDKPEFQRISTYPFIVVFSRILRLSIDKFMLHILKRVVFLYLEIGEKAIQRIRELYHDFKNFASGQIEKVVKIVPLIGFNIYDIKIKKLQLSEFLHIRRISFEEKLMFYRNKIPESILPYTTEWIIQYDLPLSLSLVDSNRIDLDDNKYKVEEIIHALITFLRLFSNGSVGTNSVITHLPVDLPFKPMATTGYDINGLGSSTIYRAIYDENELENLKRNWNKYRDILIKTYPYHIPENDKYGNIKNSLERFNFAKQHELGELALLDFVISLEALLSKKNDRTSISKRIALRCSKLIGNNEQQRIKIYNAIKEFYDFRSILAHGGRNISGFNLTEIQSIVSASILKYLQLIEYRSHEQIIEILDFGSVESSVV